MPQFNFDIRTIISLLFLGNLLAVGILAAYQKGERGARQYWHYLAGKTLQAFAWALLSLRGEISDLISVYWGNSVLFIGFALEVSAVSSVERVNRRMEYLYAAIAGCGILIFWAFAAAPGQRVALASITTVALYGTAAVVMLAKADASRLRRLIAVLYGLFCLVLLARTASGVLAPNEFGLFSASVVQTLSFLMAFALALVGGIGFLLLLKERSDRLLVESERTLKAIIENEPECVKVIGRDGTLLQMNRAGLNMIEADNEAQVLGRDVSGIVAPAYREAFIDLNRRVIDGGSGSLEFEVIGLKGGRRWLETRAVPLRNASGQISGLLGVTRDITEHKKVKQDLERLAQIDSLTGLANRRHFMLLAEQELSRTLRYGGPLSLFMIDIDHFKSVNDTHGHQIGDSVLQTLGNLLRQTLRDIDRVGRLGGEEFAVVLPQTDGAQALEVAERLRLIVADTAISLERGLPLRITLSIGVTSLANACTNTNIDTLLGQADSALYQAKHQGRNRVSVYRAQEEPLTRAAEQLHAL